MGPILVGIKERKYMEILSDSLDTLLWLCKILSWGGGENSWATVLKVHKQEQNINMTSQWHLFFLKVICLSTLEHLKTLQKGVASQRHSPKTRKLRSVLSHPQVVRDILRRCLEPTMAMIRDLVQIENLGSKRRQTGMVRSANKMVISSYDKKHYIIMSEYIICGNHYFFYWYSQLLVSVTYSW